MPTVPQPQLIADLMAAFRKGDKSSVARLMELLYPELRRMAAARMRREGRANSWQPTLLVNELYLELLRNRPLGGAGGGDEAERAVFLGLAGFLMKRLLILHSRPLRQRVEKVDSAELENLPSFGDDAESLQFVESLLSGLEEFDPRLRTVVELRVFEGLTAEEIGAQLGCTSRSVHTYWSFARNWLSERLGGGTAL